MNLLEQRPVVFTAMSRHMFYAREIVCTFVLQQGKVPVNPFTTFGYFLGDRVERDVIRNANNNLIMRCEEVWFFGPMANGCVAEVELAMKLGKPIKFFTVGPKLENIAPLHVGKLEFEAENEINITDFIQRVQAHLTNNQQPETIN